MVYMIPHFNDGKTAFEKDWVENQTTEGRQWAVPKGVWL